MPGTESQQGQPRAVSPPKKHKGSPPVHPQEAERLTPRKADSSGNVKPQTTPQQRRIPKITTQAQAIQQGLKAKQTFATLAAGQAKSKLKLKDQLAPDQQLADAAVVFADMQSELAKDVGDDIAVPI